MYDIEKCELSDTLTQEWVCRAYAVLLSLHKLFRGLLDHKVHCNQSTDHAIDQFDYFNQTSKQVFSEV